MPKDQSSTGSSPREGSTQPKQSGSNSQSVSPPRAFVVDTIKATTISPSAIDRQVQRKVLFVLKSKVQPTKYDYMYNSKGWKGYEAFQSGKIVLKEDLAHFYESITFGRVCGLLEAHHIRPASSVARFLTYQGSLMRGSHCSNYIASLIMREFDYRMHGLARKYGCKYGRYVDDFVFVCPPESERSLLRLWTTPLVAEIVSECGFLLNPTKTKLLYPSR